MFLYLEEKLILANYAKTRTLISKEKTTLYNGRLTLYPKNNIELSQKKI